MPNLFQLLLGLLTLVFVVYRTTIQANELRKMELMASNVQHVTNLSVLHEEIEICDSASAVSASIASSSMQSTISSSSSPVPKTLRPVAVLKEVPIINGDIEYPWTVIKYIVSMMVMYILLMALSSTFGICSAGYWILYILSFLPLSCILYFGRSLLNISFFFSFLLCL